MKRNKRNLLGKSRQPHNPASPKSPSRTKTATSVTETTFEGLPVRIVRKRVRSMSLRMDHDGVVRVTVPMNTTGLEIANLIRRHRRWVENARRRVERSMDGRTIADFSPGTPVYLWGEPLTLVLAARGPNGERKSGVYRDGGYAVMVTKAVSDAGNTIPALTRDEGQVLLKEWYRQETKAAMTARIPAMQRLTGKTAEKWTVRDTRSQWGSCTAPRGQHARISICLWLAAFPVEALEYVMVHELCHIYEMNHTPRFWMYVERFMPDYRLRKRLLR